MAGRKSGRALCSLRSRRGRFRESSTVASKKRIIIGILRVKYFRPPTDVCRSDGTGFKHECVNGVHSQAQTRAYVDVAAF